MEEQQTQADSSFTPVGMKAEPVARVDREEARSGYALYRGHDGFEAAIPEAVLERMRALGERSAPEEWYGLLVGRLCDDGRGRHVVVLGLVPDPEASAGAGFVRTQFDSELRTRTAAALLYPDGVPVGWAHGHVRHGARFSETDFRNQATWRQAHALGIVVDPFREPKVGVYRGPEGELLECVPSGAESRPAAASMEGGGVRALAAGEPLRRPAGPPSSALRALLLLVLAQFLALLLACALLAWRARAIEAQLEGLSLGLARLGAVPTSAEPLTSSPSPAPSATRRDGGADAELVCAP
jgi:proteasome lid subunit RPN8/RPN11